MLTCFLFGGKRSHEFARARMNGGVQLFAYRKRTMHKEVSDCLIVCMQALELITMDHCLALVVGA